MKQMMRRWWTHLTKPREWRFVVAETRGDFTGSLVAALLCVAVFLAWLCTFGACTFGTTHDDEEFFVLRGWWW